VAGPSARRRAVNLDFDPATVKDWTAEGDAFRGSAVRDTVAGVAGYERPANQGEYCGLSY